MKFFLLKYIFGREAVTLTSLYILGENKTSLVFSVLPAITSFQLLLYLKVQEIMLRKEWSVLEI